MNAFDNSEFEKRKAEAKEKWGATPAYKEYEEKTRDYSRRKWGDLGEGMDQIMSDFAACMRDGNAPDSAEAQQLVKKLQNYITENYYHCSSEILTNLGQMYVADKRFKDNIDKHGDSTAAFICDAINAYTI